MAPPPPVFIGSDVSRLDWETLVSSGMDSRFVNIRDLLTAFHVRFDPALASVKLLGEYSIVVDGPVWYCPGNLDLLPAQIIPDDSELRFLHRQLESVLVFFECWLGRLGVAIDQPETQRRWSNKLLQLMRLADLLPDFVISTQLVGKAPLLQSGNVIKHVSESRSISHTESFFAQVLTGEAIGLLQSSALVPLLMQPLISADVEYRSFYFGGNCATVAIPRGSVEGIIDIQYHPDDIARARLVQCPLPVDILEVISRAFGLAFYAVDYIVADARIHILEINPHFSWAWLPPKCVSGVVENFKQYWISRKKTRGHEKS